MQPTGPELEILKLLWSKQPRTARDLHDAIGEALNWSYSSTRKTLERMGDKGFVTAISQGNKKLYSAKVEKVPTLAAYVRDFANRVLELDGPLPVAMFSDSRLVNDTEIAELDALINELEQKQED